MGFKGPAWYTFDMDEKKPFPLGGEPNPLTETNKNEQVGTGGPAPFPLGEEKGQQQMPSLKDLPVKEEPPLVVPVAEQTKPQTVVAPAPDEGRVPSPPAQDISIRTMESDMEALKQGGGIPAEPEKFRPADLHKEEKEFEAQTTEAPAKAENDPEKKKHQMRVLLGVSLFILVAGLVGYFFVGPLLAPRDGGEPTVQDPEGQAPVEMTPSFEHASYFTKGADLQGTVSVSTVLLPEIRSAFTTVTGGNTSKGVLQEISFSSVAGPVSAQELLTAMIPSSDPTILATTFEKDFTAFVYYDDSGAWPGYVFKVTDATMMQSAVQPTAVVTGIFEGSDTLQNFFVSDPGEATAAFKDGGIFTGSRYRSYAAKGASFNYGWRGAYVVVSTSYTGFKAVDGYVSESVPEASTAVE